MTYLHTDPDLNARDEPTAREGALIDAVDGLLDATDPIGIIRDEAMWYLGSAMEGEDNLELVLPAGWDREIALRVLLTEEAFTVGWGGELCEDPIVTTFVAAAPSLAEMADLVDTELSRQLRVSRRRRLFAGTSEFHLLRHGSWTDLLREGSPSSEQHLKRAPHRTTLRTV
ncbi:hypothetical protein ACF08W_31370 [Streptomyces sp. NPDC015144]|uniref:hypothetical protein n=1 Tax=Streptomyces sp. NPDC015144 TaxID=3364944 RepID=UPI0036F8BDD7